MGLSASLTFSPVGEYVIDSSRVEPLLAYDDKCDLLHWHGSSAFRRSPRGPILLHPLRYFSLLSGCHRSALTCPARRRFTGTAAQIRKHSVDRCQFRIEFRHSGNRSLPCICIQIEFATQLPSRECFRFARIRRSRFRRIQTDQLRLPRSGILHVPPPSCCSTRPMFAQCPRFWERLLPGRDDAHWTACLNGTSS